MIATLPKLGRVTARRGPRTGEAIIVDLFAGAGGASLGIEAALGRAVAVAVNHDPVCIEAHSMNHPATRHLTTDVWDVDPREATGGRPVDLLWASPDCKHFSKAKGGRPVSTRVRSLAWVVIRWAKSVAPRIIMLENVEEFATWGPVGPDGRPCPTRKGATFRRWLSSLRGLGYAVEYRELVAADYGVPTTRRRLYLIARRDGEPIVWPDRTHAPRDQATALGLRPWRSAAECIEWSLPCPSIFGRRKPLAEATMRRIANGLRRYVLEAAEPFIVRSGHYSARTGDGAAFLAKHYGGVVGQSLRRTLGTVTAVDHHSLVGAWLEKYRGTGVGADARQPMPTVTSQGTHLAAVAAFLTTYYGSDRDGQDLHDPLRTVTAVDRFGLVTVDGELYRLIDIGLRMLQPRELLRAQFGRFAGEYVLLGTQRQQVAAIGNSVCPEVAEAIVRANCVGVAA